MKMKVIEKLINHPLVNGCPPSWASGWGQDKYGVWVTFTVKGGGAADAMGAAREFFHGVTGRRGWTL